MRISFLSLVHKDRNKMQCQVDNYSVIYHNKPVKKIILALLPLSYLVLLLFQKDLAMTGDLGRHLKVGEIVLQCRCVPQTNLFSYTHPDFTIVNHEWLTEVIFYLVASSFGEQSLLVLKILLIIVAASIVYRVAVQKGSLFWVTLFSFLSITIFSTRFHVLPELFSYLFISLFIFFIEQYKRTKKIYCLWILPFLEMLWVNMHLYFVFGLAMYAFFFLEKLVREKKFDKKIFLIGIATSLVTLINPSFIRGALLPFTVFHNYGFSVEENKSLSEILRPTSTNNDLAYTVILQITAFEVLIMAFFLCFFIRKQWKEINTMASGSLAVILGFKYIRCLSLFGLFGLIPLSQGFTELEERIEKRFGYPLKIIIQISAAVVVTLIVMFHIKGLFEYQILHFGFVPSAEKATDFIQSNHIQGKIFNNYIIGNYLIYKLYPKQQVFVDARPEAYPASFFDEYWRMMDDEQFFDNQVEKYDINAVVFNVAIDDPVKIRPFLTRLIYSSNWIPVYADGQITIFIKNVEKNYSVIEKYRITIPEDKNSQK